MGLEQTPSETTVLDDLVKNLMDLHKDTAVAMAKQMGGCNIESTTFWRGVQIGFHMGFMSMSTGETDVKTINKILGI